MSPWFNQILCHHLSSVSAVCFYLFGPHTSLWQIQLIRIVTGHSCHSLVVRITEIPQKIIPTSLYNRRFRSLYIVSYQILLKDIDNKQSPIKYDRSRRLCNWIESVHTAKILQIFNTLRPRQNGWHFPYDIFKCIFLFENVWIWIKISLKFVPKVRINNIPALVQIMTWCRIGDKPLSEPMMVNLLMHICVTRPQWVNLLWPNDTIWQHNTMSILTQVMACFLMAPSYYLNQCWLIISDVLWHSLEDNFTGNVQDIYPWYKIEN